MGPTEVPLRLTVCGEPGALSVTANVAVLVPGTVGEYVTLMVQLVPPATLEPHVLVWVKLVLLVPAIVMLVRLTAVLPVLDRVTGWAALLVPGN